MEELLKQLLDGQKRMDSRLESMDSRLENMDSRLENMESQMGSMDLRLGSVEEQLLENNGFIKALVHQSEYQKAQMDELTHTTARIEGRLNQGFVAIDERFISLEKDVKTVADDVGFLARKVFTHDDVIRNLKVVK